MAGNHAETEERHASQLIKSHIYQSWLSYFHIGSVQLSFRLSSVVFFPSFVSSFVIAFFLLPVLPGINFFQCSFLQCNNRVDL